MFAIITFRKSGPIKTWSAMRATNVHNARTKMLAHAVLGAPGPRHLIGGRDLVADVKARMQLTKIDPDRLRKNGVIAYEAILTASAEFFDNGADDERRDRLEAWTQAQVVWAKERYGMLRIASMVLHQDEKTPHIHLVVLPLELKVDKRRTDRNASWHLVGRTISGPGRFDEVQDVYAEAMASFGLSRGIRGSGRKHEPVPVYLARLAAKEREVDVARSAMRIENASLAAIRTSLDGKAEKLECARLEHAATVERQARDDEDRRRRLDCDRDAMLLLIAAQRQEVADAKVALAKEKVERDAYIAATEQRIADDRDALRRQAVTVAKLRDRLNEDVAKQMEASAAADRALQAAIAMQEEAARDRASAAADRAGARAMAEKIEAHRAQLLPTFRAASAFRTKIKALDGQALTAHAASTQAAVAALHVSASAVDAPAHEVRPNIIAAYARIREGAGAIR